MIILLGVIDLLTVLLAFTAMNFTAYTLLASIMLIILGAKGLWTITVSGKSIFFTLGVFDLATAVIALLSIYFGVLTNITSIMMIILAVKSIISLVS
ncbi:MAG: hypothetical protein JW791_00125 [Nanoarchaeota archaeon]|nr:hypothetical protein [Nanoarchaeota archaeon]